MVIAGGDLCDELPENSTPAPTAEPSPECPPPEDIAPCTCTSYSGSLDISCVSGDIADVLNAMNNAGVPMETVTITGVTGDELPANGFSSLQPKHIYVHETNISKIHENAFAGLSLNQTIAPHSLPADENLLVKSS